MNDAIFWFFVATYIASTGGLVYTLMHPRPLWFESQSIPPHSNIVWNQEKIHNNTDHVLLFIPFSDNKTFATRSPVAVIMEHAGPAGTTSGDGQWKSGSSRWQIPDLSTSSSTPPAQP